MEIGNVKNDETICEKGYDGCLVSVVQPKDRNVSCKEDGVRKETRKLVDKITEGTRKKVQLEYMYLVTKEVPRF